MAGRAAVLAIIILAAGACGSEPDLVVGEGIGADNTTATTVASTRALGRTPEELIGTVWVVDAIDDAPDVSGAWIAIDGLAPALDILAGDNCAEGRGGTHLDAATSEFVFDWFSWDDQPCTEAMFALLRTAGTMFVDGGDVLTLIADEHSITASHFTSVSEVGAVPLPDVPRTTIAPPGAPATTPWIEYGYPAFEYTPGQSQMFARLEGRLEIVGPCPYVVNENDSGSFWTLFALPASPDTMLRPEGLTIDGSTFRPGDSIVMGGGTPGDADFVSHWPPECESDEFFAGYSVEPG